MVSVPSRGTGNINEQSVLYHRINFVGFRPLSGNREYQPTCTTLTAYMPHGTAFPSPLGEQGISTRFRRRRHTIFFV